MSGKGIQELPSEWEKIGDTVSAKIGTPYIKLRPSTEKPGIVMSTKKSNVNQYFFMNEI